jgi:hypothetical protein
MLVKIMRKWEQICKSYSNEIKKSRWWSSTIGPKYLSENYENYRMW